MAMGDVLEFRPGASRQRQGPVTGEEVLKDGARIMADYFTQALAQLDENDPWRRDVHDLVARFRGLAGRGA